MAQLGLLDQLMVLGREGDKSAQKALDAALAEAELGSSIATDTAEYLRLLCLRTACGDDSAELVLRYRARTGELPSAWQVLRCGLNPDGSRSADRGQGEREDGWGTGLAE